RRKILTHDGIAARIQIQRYFQSGHDTHRYASHTQLAVRGSKYAVGVDISWRGEERSGSGGVQFHIAAHDRDLDCRQPRCGKRPGDATDAAFGEQVGRVDVGELMFEGELSADK